MTEPDENIQIQGWLNSIQRRLSECGSYPVRYISCIPDSVGVQEGYWQKGWQSEILKNVHTIRTEARTGLPFASILLNPRLLFKGVPDEVSQLLVCESLAAWPALTICY
jgi:hypothetical protein